MVCASLLRICGKMPMKATATVVEAVIRAVKIRTFEFCAGAACVEARDMTSLPPLEKTGQVSGSLATNEPRLRIYPGGKRLPKIPARCQHHTPGAERCQ